MYSLNEALDRLNVEARERKRILYLKLPPEFYTTVNNTLEKFGLGLPEVIGFHEPLSNLIGVVSDGDQVLTDAILAHEIFGHRKQGLLRTLGLSVEGRQESIADEIMLHKLVELEKKYPDTGYGAFRSKVIDRIRAYKEGKFPYSKHPARRVVQKIRNWIYYSKIDLAVLK